MESTTKPLLGKRIVVTRASEQAGEITRMLEQLGAEVIPLPAVEFSAPADAHPLDRALRELGEFDWVLFTSQNAVRFTALRLRQTGMPATVRQVAVVGPATADAASREGFRVDYVATHSTAHALAGELGESLNGCTVFLPRSDRSDPELVEALRESGATVTDAIAYRTVAPAVSDPAALNRIHHADVDVAIFSSPSAFQNLDGMLGAGTLAKLAGKVRYAAIGPTTAKAMRSAGVRVHIEAEEASSAGLADAIVKYFQEHPAPSRHL